MSKKRQLDGAQIVIRMSKKEKEALEKEAQKEGLTLSAYVRRILMGIQERVINE